MILYIMRMSISPDSPHIFISAAEASADQHGASLIQAVQALCPGARFTGVAGPQMQQAGCKSIYDMTRHSSMLAGAVAHVHHGYRMLRLSAQELSGGNFHAAVVIDSPILNLRIAGRAKSLGIPVLYYIAPQLWAWAAAMRIGKVRRSVDRLACILPFEEPYFRAFGLEANYVGHPLFAKLAARKVDQSKLQRLQQSGSSVLTIMPGSRQHVVSENFPNQLAVAGQLRSRFPGLRILVSVAHPRIRRVLDQISHSTGVQAEYHEGSNAELLAAADLALISSGTATLEAAYHHTPMIVMYNASRFMYQNLMRFVIATEYFSLPNILANRELVPEFMPFYRSIDPIVARGAELLGNSDARARMSRQLKELIQPFLDTPASQTTAHVLLDLIENRENGKQAADRGQ